MRPEEKRLFLENKITENFWEAWIWNVAEVKEQTDEDITNDRNSLIDFMKEYLEGLQDILGTEVEKYLLTDNTRSNGLRG